MHSPQVLILAASLAVGAAAADERVAQVGRDELRTFDASCEYSPVLRFIPEDAQPDYRKAVGEIQGKRFFGCWREEDAVVHVWWEDGDQSMVPARSLKRVMNI